MLATTAKSSIITLTQRPAAFTPAPLIAPGTEAAATLTTLPPSDSRNVAHSLAVDSLAWSTVTNIQLCFAIHLYGMVVGRFAGSVRLMFGLFVVSRRSNTATIIASRGRRRRGLSMAIATTRHTQTHPDCSFFSFCCSL